MNPTIKSCIAIHSHEWVRVPGEYYPRCAVCNNTWRSEYGAPPNIHVTQIGGFKSPSILYQYLYSLNGKDNHENESATSRIT